VISLFVWVESEDASAQTADIAFLAGKSFPAVVMPAIDTELPGTSIVQLDLRTFGPAVYANLICPYEAIRSASPPRIRLHCTEMILHNHPLEGRDIGMDGEFYDRESGQIGIPARRRANGALRTDSGGQAGVIFINQVFLK
jgi:hypothetical protein